MTVQPAPTPERPAGYYAPSRKKPTTEQNGPRELADVLPISEEVAESQPLRSDTETPEVVDAEQKRRERHQEFMGRYAASLNGGPSLSAEDRPSVDAGTRQLHHARIAALGQNAGRILDDANLPWNRVKKKKDSEPPAEKAS
jgi:hypothetical protein